jgi:hypothetical protein
MELLFTAIVSLFIVALFWLTYSFWSVLFAASRFTFMRKMARRFDQSHSVGYNILSNIRVTPGELENLSHDSNQYLRRVVASHRNTPEDTLRRLSKDDSPMVRASLLDNPKTPDDISTLIALEMMVDGTLRKK